MEAYILKLRPRPVFKPWGLVHEPLRDIAGISVGVGELWLASAQAGAGNVASEVIGDGSGGDLAGVLDQAGHRSVLNRWLGATAMQALETASFRGKTEAWLVRDAQGFCGFASGPPGEEEKEQLRQLLTGPGLSPDVRGWPADVCRWLGLIAPLERGDSFLVPAGTLHTMFALGKGSRLVVDEIQQGYGAGMLPTLSKLLLVEDSLLSIQVHPDDETVRMAAEGELDIRQDLQSDPTIRVYDFGRRPGEYPELGFRLTNPDIGLRRVGQVHADIDGCRQTFIVACSRFVMIRLTISPGGETSLLPPFGSYRVLHCTKGELQLGCGGDDIHLGAGETVFVPAVLEKDLRMSSRNGCELLDQAVPDPGILQEWLTSRGVAAGDIRQLLDPPRA